MPTRTAANARAQAQAATEHAPNRIGAAFDQLEQQLNRHGGALTASDLDDIRSVLTAKLGNVCELLVPQMPERIWTEELK